MAELTSLNISPTVDSDPSDSTVARRRLSYWIVGAGLTLSYFLLRGMTWQGGPYLHTTMESVAMVLAVMVGVMALARFYSRRNDKFLFIGTGFLGTAFLDGYHTVVTLKFFVPYFSSAMPSLIPWSWVASRMFLSVMLTVAWVAWVRRKHHGKKRYVNEALVYLSVAAFTIAILLFFAFVPLPLSYYPELPFHRPEEFLPAAFFLLALFGFLRKGKWRTDPFEHWLVISLIVAVVSQAVFMSFSGQVFDLEFDVAHLLKKVSYICVLIGLLLSMCALFHKAETANARLQKEIGERERAEYRLNLRAEELARSNQELEQFAYVASHDLQEPLRKVQAFGDLLKTKYADELGEQGEDYIVRMQDAADRMRTLIQSLLSFSRVATKGQPFEPVDLNELVKTVLSDLDILVQETGAQIKIANLPSIDGDPSQLRQLLQNLIGNAIKYRRDGIPPIVEITSKCIERRTGPTGNRVRNLCHMEVIDNGIGFEDQYAERIFGIFQRLHGRDQYEGTGVGLSIARKITDRHGGSISAKGRPGEGATFSVTLPINHRERGRE